MRGRLLLQQRDKSPHLVQTLLLVVVVVADEATDGDGESAQTGL